MQNGFVLFFIFVSNFPQQIKYERIKAPIELLLPKKHTCANECEAVDIVEFRSHSELAESLLLINKDYAIELNLHHCRTDMSRHF